MKGTGALDKQEWSAALSALEAADRQLTNAPSTVKGDFAQLPSLIADAKFAVAFDEGVRQLRNAAFAASATAFERAASEGKGAETHYPSVRPLATALPARVAEARLGQQLLDADAAMRERRWAVAISAYESAQKQASGVDFVSARAKELATQAPAQERQARLQLALEQRRFADALQIDRTNKVALEGQYGLAITAFDAERWSDAAAALAVLKTASSAYKDVADRDLATTMQLELAEGLKAREARTPGRSSRDHFERVLKLQEMLRGPLRQVPVVAKATADARSALDQMDSDAAFEAATTFFRKGDWDQARSTVRLSLEKVPGRKDALDLLSQMNAPGLENRSNALTNQANEALARGDLVAAESAARALLALVKDSDPAIAVLAQVESSRSAQNRRYAYAASLGVLALGPLLLVSQKRRGRFLAFVGRPKSALRLFEQVLSRNPADRSTLAHAATLASTYKLPSGIDTNFDAYLGAQPHDVEMALTAADYFWSAGAHRRSGEVYEHILSNGKGSLPPRAFDRLAEMHPSGVTAQTLSLLEKEHARNNENAGLTRLLAREYGRDERLDAGALAVYRAASAQTPDDASLRILLARALLEQGQIRDAMNEAEQAAHLRVDDTQPLDVLVSTYERSFADAPDKALADLATRHLPATALLIIGERLATALPNARTAIAGLYEQQAASVTESVPRVLFTVHRALDSSDFDAANAALNEAAEAPTRSPIGLRALIQAHERYLRVVAERGRPPEPEILARMAHLQADGGWWLDAVTTWQSVVSVPEWNRRSMTAIQNIIDPRTLREIAQVYFVTAGWLVDDAPAGSETTGDECDVAPGPGITAKVASRFSNTLVFCRSDVVSVDDVVALKRRVLERSTSGGAVAFLIAGQAIRHDVYALIYAFMTEEPAVTLVPLEIQPVRDAIVEARSRHHLERTLLQWLGHTDVYETHNPVSNAATFFGRGHFINQLVLKISRGENFGVFGMRKIGKTSLVYRLRELSRDHLVAYVDLQGVSSWKVTEVYIRLIESLVRDMRIKHPDVPVPEIKTSPDRSQQTEVASAFHTDVLAVRRAFETAGRPLPHMLLLLDEIELMIPGRGSNGFEGHQDFFRHIRGLYQQERFIVSAVVGASPSVCRTAAWDGRDNPVFQFYDEVFLATLDRGECDQMVQGLGEVMGVRFDTPSLKRIFDETSGHPYVARQLCSRLVKAFPDRPLEVNEGMVDVAVEDYLAQRGEYFTGVLESYLDTVPRRIVETIGAADEAGADRLSILKTLESVAEGRHVGDQALGDLELTGLARRTGDRYALRIPLFRRWLRRSWLGLE